MKEIFAHENPESDSEISIFLAGPSPRGKDDYNWREKALNYMREKNFSGDAYVPLPRDGNWLADYDAQVDWELKYLNKAKIIAFWMPRDLIYLPGFTSNVEFGMFLKSGKIVLGYPVNAERMRYLHYVANINNIPVFNTMEKTLDCAMGLSSKN